jgi:hypothetical protein
VSVSKIFKHLYLQMVELVCKLNKTLQIVIDNNNMWQVLNVVRYNFLSKTKY